MLDTAMQRGGGKQHIQEIRDGSSFSFNVILKRFLIGGMALFAQIVSVPKIPVGHGVMIVVESFRRRCSAAARSGVTIALSPSAERFDVHRVGSSSDVR